MFTYLNKTPPIKAHVFNWSVTWIAIDSDQDNLTSTAKCIWYLQLYIFYFGKMVLKQLDSRCVFLAVKALKMNDISVLKKRA